ncbi:MAG TPA: hypothetical protein VML55_19155, partial [Planctomycetaceae bacterium]|nr:hypothetical protein [Planctomycetaceae bacterium]
MSHPDDWGRPERKMSSGTKILLICLGIAGVCLLVCCGGGYYLVRTRVEFHANDPAAAAAVAAEIADIEVPEGFEPRHAMRVNLPLVPSAKAAFYERDDGDGVLVISEVGAAADDSGAQREMNRALARRDESPQELETVRSESRVFRIRGQDVRFQFAEAQDEDGRQYRVVSGPFPGKGGTAQL